MSRQIVFIGYRILDFPYRREVTEIFQLSKSDRTNYEIVHGIARDRSQFVEITTTDRMKSLLSDKRLRWTGTSCTGEPLERMLQR